MDEGWGRPWYRAPLPDRPASDTTVLLGPLLEPLDPHLPTRWASRQRQTLPGPHTMGTFTAAPLYLQAPSQTPWCPYLGSSHLKHHLPMPEKKTPGTQILGAHDTPNIPQVRILKPHGAEAGQGHRVETRWAGPVRGAQGLFLEPQFPPLTKEWQWGPWGAELASAPGGGPTAASLEA